MSSVPRGLAPLLLGAFRPWLGLALVCGGFSLNERFLHTFWTASYLPNLVQQAATNIILAVGMTFVILTGGIDLSVGSVLALCGVAMGLTVTPGPPWYLAAAMAVPLGVLAAVAVRRAAARRGGSSGPAAAAAGAAVVVLGAVAIARGTQGGVRLEWAVVAALALGTACGLANGLVTTLARVPAFVTTLGMFTAARGLTVYATDGNSVPLPHRLGPVGEGTPLVVITALVVAAGAILLTRTRAGRYITAIGGNEQAARLTGVDVTAYKTLAYGLSGLAAAIAAVVLTAKFRVADTGAGANAELSAIAAVVIGGTSLSGGQGSVTGSLVGALTIATLNAGLVIVGVKDTLQGVIIGCVIILTVALDQLGKGREAGPQRGGP